MQSVTYPFPVKKISLPRSVDLAYMDEGNGAETLLFLHGLSNYAAVWKYQIRELSKTYRCIAVDLPGNGLSSRGEYPYTPFFYAESIRLFCESLQLDQPALVGHSMGGQVSIMLALRFPHLFQKLVLVAPAGIEYFSAADQLLLRNLVHIGDFLYSDELHLEHTIRESFEVPGDETTSIIHDLKKMVQGGNAKNWKEMCKASVDGMLNEQVNPYLHQLTARVLLIFGERDKLIPNRLLHPLDTPSKIAHQGAALIPQCEMHLLPNAGHFVQIEKYQEVNKLILDWCKQVC